MDWGVFLTTVGSSTLAVAALAYLAKALAKLLIDRDIKRFTSQLERENLEHEVRFKRVDEKIADTLSAVYDVLYALVDALRQYLHPVGDKQQSRQALAEARKHFEDTFFRKRLYIPPDLFQKVCDLYGKSATLAEEFTNALDRVEKAVETEEDHHFWSRAIDGLNAETEPLFRQIVSDFQTRIGVQSSFGRKSEAEP